MTDVMQGQVAGAHYRDLGMQPVEFAMKNAYDFACASALKYLTRWRAKNGQEDLRKARHFVQLREEFAAHRRLASGAVPVALYCDLNGLRGLDAQAVQALDMYARWPSPHACARLLEWIDILILEARQLGR